MVTKKGTIESEKYNESPVITGNKKVWFLNKDLVRIHHYNHSNGIMSVYNITKDQIERELAQPNNTKESISNLDKILKKIFPSKYIELETTKRI